VLLLKREFIEWLIAIVIATVLYFVVKTFFFISYSVSGDSMYPTFTDGDKVIVNKMSTLHHGDVIVFHTGSTQDYVKRIIGKSGDKVEYRDDVLYVNGERTDEPYLQENRIAKTNILLTENFKVSDLSGAGGKSVIPEGKLLVLGDNRETSNDSRRFGLIKEQQVVGEVQVRYWPLDTFHVNFNPQ